MSGTKDALTPPTLPDGYFFRAGNSEGSTTWYDGDRRHFFGVSIRRRRWYGSYPCYSTSNEMDIDTKTIHAAMVELADRFYENHNKVLAKQAALKLHSGDYPPKKLEVTR